MAQDCGALPRFITGLLGNRRLVRSRYRRLPEPSDCANSAMLRPAALLATRDQYPAANDKLVLRWPAQCLDQSNVQGINGEGNSPSGSAPLVKARSEDLRRIPEDKPQEVACRCPYSRCRWPVETHRLLP